MKILKWQVLQLPIVQGLLYFIAIVIWVENEVEIYKYRIYSFVHTIFVATVRKLVLVHTTFSDCVTTARTVGHKHVR